ncbi:MAG: hypothetical protein HY301_18665 [Verrucomicrobia bacterium]|nr:hypothetical protein [Verrucomicrobiota bacterium]
MRRKTVIACLIAVSVGSLADFSVRRHRSCPDAAAGLELVETHRLGEYQLRIWRRTSPDYKEWCHDKFPQLARRLFGDRVPYYARNDACAELRRRDETILVVPAFGECAVTNAGLAGEFPIHFGLSIHGDGTSNLVIFHDERNDLTYRYVDVYELGDSFKTNFSIQSHPYVNPPVFRDLDGDGIPEILIAEGCFVHFSHGTNEMIHIEPPQIALRWQRGEYRVATDLMRKHAPTQDEEESLIEELKSRSTAPPTDGSEILSEVLRWRYAGQMEFAKKLLDQTWPKDEAHAGLLQEFEDTLSSSDYWSAIQTLRRDSGTRDSFVKGLKK